MGPGAQLVSGFVVASTICGSSSRANTECIDMQVSCMVILVLVHLVLLLPESVLSGLFHVSPKEAEQSCTSPPECFSALGSLLRGGPIITFLNSGQPAFCPQLTGLSVALSWIVIVAEWRDRQANFLAAQHATYHKALGNMAVCSGESSTNMEK
jgi:hypothetical protein